MSDTIPGGRYLGTDGEEHDANGNKIGSKENKAAVAAIESTTAEQGQTQAPEGAGAKKAGTKAGTKSAKRSGTKPK